MKSLRDIIIVIIGLLIIGICVFLLQRPKEKVYYEMPVSVVFKSPEIRYAHDTVFLDKIVYRDNVVYKELSYNKELEKRYKAAKDSIAKLNIYLEAITEHEYTITYSDTVQDIKVYTRSRGEVLAQQVDYTLFPREYSLDTILSIPERTKIKIWGRAAVGIPTYNPEYDKPVIGSVGLIFKNRKDNILTLDMDTDLRVWLGFAKKF